MPFRMLLRAFLFCLLLCQLSYAQLPVELCYKINEPPGCKMVCRELQDPVADNCARLPIGETLRPCKEGETVAGGYNCNELLSPPPTESPPPPTETQVASAEPCYKINEPPGCKMACLESQDPVTDNCFKLLPGSTLRPCKVGETVAAGYNCNEGATEKSSSDSNTNTTSLLIIVGGVAFVLVCLVVVVLVVVLFVFRKKREEEGTPRVLKETEMVDVQPSHASQNGSNIFSNSGVRQGVSVVSGNTAQVVNPENQPDAGVHTISSASNFAPRTIVVRSPDDQPSLAEDPNTSSLFVPTDWSALLCFKKNDEFQKTKVIGRGSFGTVFSCVLADGAICAMKEIGLGSENLQELQEIGREFDLVRALKHENVVQYFGVNYDRGQMQLQIFMELVPCGSVGGLVRGLQEPLSERVLRTYARQLFTALKYVHGKGVVHRDIKSDNLLISHDGKIKLADFGASKKIGGGTRAAQTMIGTPFFMAPEMLSADDNGENAAGYGKAADVWSAGITILEMANRGNPPWPQFSNLGAAFMHISNPNSMPFVPPHLSDDCKDFLGVCLKRHPKERLSSAELLNHKWLQAEHDDMAI